MLSTSVGKRNRLRRCERSIYYSTLKARQTEVFERGPLIPDTPFRELVSIAEVTPHQSQSYYC